MYTCLLDILEAEKKAVSEIEFQTKEQERLRNEWESLSTLVSESGLVLSESDYFMRQKRIFHDQINVCIESKKKAEKNLESVRISIKKYFLEL